MEPNDSSSSCEYQSEVLNESVSNNEQLEYLDCKDFDWSGRESIAYKDISHTSFKNIKRVELIGKQAEQCQFDLRYFEIQQQGYSSKEKHQHTHVIIIARGQGKVIVDDREYDVKENDVLYIKPMSTHQLVNSSSDKFGFYCIVDRERDKPIVVD